MKYVLWGIGLILLFAALIFFVPIVTQWAWANFMTPVFGMRLISWKEAFALSLLAGLFRSVNIRSIK